MSGLAAASTTTSVSNKLKVQGNAKFQARKWREAIALYTQAIDVDGNNFQAYSNRSAAKLKIKDVDGAVADARKTTEIEPSWHKGWVRLAEALRNTGGKANIEEGLSAIATARQMVDCAEFKKIDEDLREGLLMASMAEEATKDMLRDMNVTLADLKLNEDATFEEIHERLADMEKSGEEKLFPGIMKFEEKRKAEEAKYDNVDFKAAAAKLEMDFQSICLSFTYMDRQDENGAQCVLTSVVDSTTGKSRGMHIGYGGPPEPDEAVKILFKAFAFPMEASGDPCRPNFVLIAHRFGYAYDVIRDALKSLDIRCRLESYAEACVSAAQYGNHPMGLLQTEDEEET